jgi:CPA2 family monovalent cation:H+ antiporter-2
VFACQDRYMPAASTSEAFASIFLEFGLLLLGLGILARIAHVLSISPVPLYLIAGLFFGDGGIVGIPASDGFVATIAELGVVLLLLLLGLEYSATELVRTARQQSRSGAVDLLLNATPGVLMALVLGWGWVGALALGGITYISSSGIVSQVVRDLRWRRNPETAPVVSVLVIEDLVMAPYLPILSVVLTGAGLVSGLITVGTALLVVAIVIVISLKGTVRFQRVLSPRDPVGLLLIVFGAAIAAAGLAGLVDFSPAVAAFLVGLLLTGEVAEVARRRLDPLRDVLAAVFFAYFGLVVDPGELPAVLLPAALLAVVTIGTKFITGWVAARSVRGTAIGALRAGALLAARGEFSVVIAGLVAVSLVLPSTFQAFVAAYVLITASAGPLLARFAEPIGWWWEQRPPRRRRTLEG